jgi:hypothetical protein
MCGYIMYEWMSEHDNVVNTKDYRRTYSTFDVPHLRKSLFLGGLRLIRPRQRPRFIYGLRVVRPRQGPFGVRTLFLKCNTRMPNICDSTHIHIKCMNTL